MKQNKIPYSEPSERMIDGYQEYISTDKMGSYTGLSKEPFEQPVQDADDL